MASFSDDFNRADGAIGSNYTTMAGSTNGFVVNTNQLQPAATTSAFIYRNDFTASGDFYAQYDEGATQPVNGQISMNLSDSGGNNYAFGRGFDGAAVIKKNGTNVGNVYSPGSYSAGTVRLQKVGSVISALLNGTTVCTYTDGSPFTPTLACLSNNLTGADTTVRIDNFSGGDIVAAGASVPARRAFPMSILHH